MTVTVRQLAELVQGKVFGDETLPIRAARPLREAQPGDITFVEDAKYTRELPACLASAVIAPESIPVNGRVLIQVDDPLSAFATIVRHLHGRPEPPVHGVDPRACVDPSTVIGPDASVYPLAVIGEGTVIGARCRIHSGVVIGRRCRLGDDVILYSNVVLYDDTVLGNRVIVHGNAVLGADGFGYRLHDGRHVKVPQLGHLEIEDDVEIGAGTTIDRGTFQATRIGTGTKIDNLVQIGHNCRIGRHNLIVSLVGMAGSSSTGDYVVLAGQAGVVGHIHIGDGACIGGQAGVTKDVAPGQRLIGCPARPERDHQRAVVNLEKVPEMRKDIRRIKQHLGLADE